MSESIIVVAQTSTNEYGDLLITTKGGEQVKIKAKRSNLFPLFEQGKAVMLEWQTYQNHPYIANAKLVEGELPPPQEPVSPGGETSQKSERQNNSQKGYALSYSKDLAVSGNIKFNQVIFVAELFNQYLLGNIEVPMEVIIKFISDQTKASLKTE